MCGGVWHLLSILATISASLQYKGAPEKVTFPMLSKQSQREALEADDVRAHLL